MSVSALVGLQWGDEGKGKIVDVLSRSVEIIVRAQGGANAGHTVKVGDKTHILHLVPSGVIEPRSVGVIGNGVVVDPVQLVKEIKNLEAAGVAVRNRLLLSDRAHLVLGWHKALDVALEVARGAQALGTTKRGIGPTYSDKASRSGIRVGDLLRPDQFRARVREEGGLRNRLLAALGHAPVDPEAVADEALQTLDDLRPLITDTVAFLLQAHAADRNILLEGAQGALLDVDLGTYPFVTSSNCHVGGLLAGSGLPPRALDRVLGVSKAYCTRVGAGPFPSELQGPLESALRERGREFGATTGRPRRCGWLDLVALRYAVLTNGVDEIALMKSDVLVGLGPISVVTHYRIDGQVHRDFPAGEALWRVEPVLRELGPIEDFVGRGSTETELPQVLRDLVALVEDETRARVSVVSVGPERSQTIFRS